MKSGNRPVLATIIVGLFFLIGSFTPGCSSQQSPSQQDGKALYMSLLATPFPGAGPNWGNALGSDAYYGQAVRSAKPIGGVTCGIGVSGQPQGSIGELTYTVYATSSDAAGWLNRMKARPNGVNGTTGLDVPSILALEYSDPSGLDLGSQPTFSLVQVENVIIYVRLPALWYKDNPNTLDVIDPFYDQVGTQEANISTAAAAVAHLKQVQLSLVEKKQ